MAQKEYHPAPEWLTMDYFEPILRKYIQDDTLKIQQFETKPATAKGENYASVMTRVHVVFTINDRRESQKGNYIAKTSHENDPVVANMMSKYDVYNTEMKMYELILPQMSALLREAGDMDKLFADTIHVDYEHSAIIFEDLSVLNYVIADRLKGMNLSMAKLALKKLAKMHATAAVLQERGVYELRSFNRGIFNRHTRKFDVFFINMFRECAKYAGDYPGLGPYYKNKLLNLQNYVMEYAERVTDSHEGHFETLCHGDFWVNNIMLRYNDSSACPITSTNSLDEQNNGLAIKGMLLIDLQFCAWTSPAIDLHYFLQTSLQSNVLQYNEDELVQYYYGILRDTLLKLKFKGTIPSLHKFVIQLEAGRFHAVTAAITQAPMMKNDKTEDADLHALMDEDDRAHRFRNLLYQNKVIQDDLKRLLPYFDRKGLLDTNE